MKIKLDKHHKYGIGAVSLAILLIVVMLGYLFMSNAPAKQTNRQSTETEVADALPAELGDLLATDALLEIVKADIPESTVSVVELEQEGQSVVYKVYLSDGSVVRYNAVTGSRIGTATINTEEDHHELPAGFVAALTFVQARDIAVSQKPNVAVRKIELETEGTAVVYSVRFVDRGRIDVNALTGEIVRIKEGEQHERGNNAEHRHDNSGSGSANSGRNDDSVSSDDSSDGSADDSTDSNSDTDSSGSDEGDDSSDSIDDSSDDSSGSNSGSGSRN